ncbi:pentapeptide repeat-containing protein [Dapis sp. BLCC M229]|uniref:pentapeptide repeat-containing protein n=1 Tax=Dapis sp. BLCC M229 TaxID=3400188 RepID=UPI003CF048D2
MTLSSKNFDSLNLYRVNLSGLDLKQASFRNANLRYVDLSNTNLDGADFTDADLTQTNLAGAQLNEVNFTDANLSEANLQGSQLCNAILERACLQGANLNQADLTNANICNWKISSSTTIEGIQGISDNEINIDLSQQQWKKIDATLEELYQLKGMADRETWNEHFFDKAKDMELPPHIYNHLFNKYYESHLFRESRNSFRVYLLRDLQFLKIERSIESLNYSIAHLDIFPILEKLEKLSIIGALFLLINTLIEVDYESQYRTWEIINSDQEEVFGGTHLGLERLAQEGNSLEWLQAENTELNGINLRNANLKKANFSKAKLREADLRNSDLREADLREADLRNAKLRGAKLEGADLEGADLEGADLEGVDLKDIDLKGVVLKGAKLTRVQLKDLKRKKANLSGVDLSSANLRGINLSEANLRGINLSEANLRRANLSKANLSEANLRGADLRGAKGLTVEQVRQAKNWKSAKFDSYFQNQLDNPKP